MGSCHSFLFFVSPLLERGACPHAVRLRRPATALKRGKTSLYGAAVASLSSFYATTCLFRFNFHQS